MRLVLRAQKTINCDPLLGPERGTIAVVRQRRKIIKQEAKSPSVLLQPATPFPFWQSLMEAVSQQRRKAFRGSALQSPSKVQKDNSLIICSQEEADSSCRVRITNYLKLFKDVYGALASFLHTAWQNSQSLINLSIRAHRNHHVVNRNSVLSIVLFFATGTGIPPVRCTCSFSTPTQYKRQGKELSNGKEMQGSTEVRTMTEKTDDQQKLYWGRLRKMTSTVKKHSRLMHLPSAWGTIRKLL